MKKRGLIRLSIAIVIVVILFSYLKFAWPGFGGNSKPANLQDILDRISIRQDELGQMEPGSGSIAKKEKDKVSFTSTIDLGKDDIVTIRTLFNTTSDTVQKRTVVEHGREKFSYTIILKGDLLPYKQSTYGNYHFYYRDDEVILYSQARDPKGGVFLKEWIYASSPNNDTGSVYEWQYRSDSPGSFLKLKGAQDGSVELYRCMQISGIDSTDPKERASVIETVKKALGDKFNIGDERLMARISQPAYWTNDGQKKTGTFSVAESNILTVSIDEPESSYPLLIDPSVAWDVGDEIFIDNVY